MKKRFFWLLAATVICISALSVTSFAVGENSTAQNAIIIGNEEVTDNLPDKTSERWYKFENKTKGDVVVYLNNTDNVQNIWRVYLFDSTAQNELSYENCVGTSYNKSYQSLDAGIYYLKITIGGSYQHESFDNLNYTVRVRTLADVNIVPNENGAYVFTEEKQEMFVLDGRVYSKMGDGITVAALGYDYNGDSYIMLVGESEADVGFYESSPDFTKTTHKEAFVYENDEEYYYLTLRLYSRELMSDLYVCNNGEKTKYDEDNAYELMNLYNGKNADEGKDSLWRELQKDYGPLLMIGLVIGGIVGLAAVIVIIKVIAERINGRNRRPSGSYSPVVTNDYPSTDNSASTDELMDMDIAKQVIQNIGGTDGI